MGPGLARTFTRPGVAAITTPDTLLFGFGLEQRTSPADRTRLMALAIKHLLHRDRLTALPGVVVWRTKGHTTTPDLFMSSQFT